MWKDTGWRLIEGFNALHKQNGVGLFIKDTQRHLVALATNDQNLRIQLILQASAIGPDW